MDTLVVFHTCPHPLNPAPEYPKRPVSFHIRTSDALAADDGLMEELRYWMSTLQIASIIGRDSIEGAGSLKALIDTARRS